MKVTATRPVYVNTSAGKILLQKGESAEVDGRSYGPERPFIKEGYLVAEREAEKPKRKPKSEPTPEPVEVETDGDTDEE